MYIYFHCIKISMPILGAGRGFYFWPNNTTRIYSYTLCGTPIVRISDSFLVALFLWNKYNISSFLATKDLYSILVLRPTGYRADMKIINHQPISGKHPPDGVWVLPLRKN